MKMTQKMKMTSKMKTTLKMKVTLKIEDNLQIVEDHTALPYTADAVIFCKTLAQKI